MWFQATLRAKFSFMYEEHLQKHRCQKYLTFSVKCIQPQFKVQNKLKAVEFQHQ